MHLLDRSEYLLCSQTETGRLGLSAKGCYYDTIHTYLTLFVWEYKAVCCDGYAIHFISYTFLNVLLVISIQRGTPSQCTLAPF